ncbi:hypothetical protein A2382_02015 [Candidatus Woesebacteria bacterium RIFOXYB1_FULL_38_16]|uniref:Uncharacterized protein n=1 Tax=Candidatus Woesebacteria bacterium RIFOXYB1_FULL_38_16 TaxID=1802538 RepID=A0A1F8CTM0_9BACT|nr:MAG: hypothetical protein A2191_04875 [Candidatus Woesebacteria bacterium RIFOXYA1_FULL_38_9]OGM79674.1 MAG: hypothetical protein A2382_02015 [Candidatus Woesebacteria bacterium RIFOXYB1_FULL_38_16]
MNQVNKDNLTDLTEVLPEVQNNNEPANVPDNSQEQVSIQSGNSINEPQVKPVTQELAENQVVAQDGSVIDLGTTPPVIK